MESSGMDEPDVLEKKTDSRIMAFRGVSAPGSRDTAVCFFSRRSCEERKGWKAPPG